MRALGAELSAFYSAWPVGPDFHHDDGYRVDDNDKLMVDPTTEYDVSEVLGYFVWQGQGSVPPSIEINDVYVPIPQDWHGPDPVEAFKAWRGDRRAVVVLVPPDQVSFFKSICEDHGWKAQD